MSPGATEGLWTLLRSAMTPAAAPECQLRPSGGRQRPLSLGLSGLLASVTGASQDTYGLHPLPGHGGLLGGTPGDLRNLGC